LFEPVVSPGCRSKWFVPPVGSLAVRYSIGHADIAHQRVEDEVIVVNLQTGAYFSLRQVAADAWDLLVGGTDVAVAAELVAGRYAVTVEQVAADLAPFVGRLLEDGLVALTNAASDGAVDLPPVAAGVTYKVPTLDKYDDMEELLLLDPIHEVDEAGWPVVATEPTE